MTFPNDFPRRTWVSLHPHLALGIFIFGSLQLSHSLSLRHTFFTVPLCSGVAFLLKVDDCVHAPYRSPMPCPHWAWPHGYPLGTLNRVPSHAVNVPTVPQGPSSGPGSVPLLPRYASAPHECSNFPFLPHSRQSGCCFYLFNGMALSGATSDVNCKSQGTL